MSEKISFLSLDGPGRTLSAIQYEKRYTWGLLGAQEALKLIQRRRHPHIRGFLRPLEE